VALVAKANGGGHLGDRLIAVPKHPDGKLDALASDGFVKSLAGGQPISLREPTRVEIEFTSQVDGREVRGSCELLPGIRQPTGRPFSFAPEGR
jgi:hypothetical protein